ncbi:MAG: sulfatase-like hydrolase/transferase [Verrucomicrobiales bacterium]
MKPIHALFLSIALPLLFAIPAPAAEKPHVVFVMADDMGWGQTGYYDHPVLETPHLDAMAENGLRFDRFYAGAPVCSPTRASVLTGRANDRTGVLQHGYALRLQEKTIAEALGEAGYVSGHFGKWHLNGLRGPGAPILPHDPRGPAAFGFDEWVSVTNFYDVDPLMSRMGEIEQFTGDSSEIAVDEAVKFLSKHRDGDKSLFAVIWYGTPHAPFKALPEDVAPFSDLDEDSANHYGELVAMDRSLGTLRARLRELDLADDTLLVFCSDNGGLTKIEPGTVGSLRGHKRDIFEGGLRVPCVMEWPGTIEPRVTDYPASTMDLFPTVADILDLPDDALTRPVDGVSLRPLFQAETEPESRELPIPFRFENTAALVDNRYKLLTTDRESGQFELYDLETDPRETEDVSQRRPEVFERMKGELVAWSESVDASFAGKDYPEGTVTPPDPEPRFWFEGDLYRDHLPEWRERWEFKTYFERVERRQARKEKEKEKESR